MINDLQLMKDIAPLFEKAIVMWGVGHRGKVFLNEIITMGAGKRGIFLCDSDFSHWGEMVDDQNVILSPKELTDRLEDVDLGEIIFLVTVLSTKAQDEIIRNIRNLYGESVNICTDYALEMGIFLNLDNAYINKEFREKKVLEREKRQLLDPYRFFKERVLRYFAFLPLDQDKFILVYQCGKVGSTSIYQSIEKCGYNALHCHSFTGVESRADDIYKLLNFKSAKIICMVRDPIAVMIAGMWQNLQCLWERYDTNVDFARIEKDRIENLQFNNEFEWFDEQMRKYTKIDVFRYPFDRENGYSIIKEGNIELLLMKLEKLDKLENVIGSFLNIDRFHLCKSNVGEEKPYRFAYRQYKENLHISREKLEEIYQKNDRMKHFYTEEERKEFYLKWDKM